jgi:hypothetical protein
MQRLDVKSILLPLLLTTACAGPNAVARKAPRVSFADIAQGQPSPAIEHLQKLPFVLYVPAGQRIPVELGIDSGLFALETGEMKLVAKRDFYVLFRADGMPLLSEDGVDFEKRAKNSFALGLNVQKDQPAKVQLGLRVRPDAETPTK